MLRRFRAAFDRPAPRSEGRPGVSLARRRAETRRRRGGFGGLSLVLANQGARSRLLAVGAETWNRWRVEPEKNPTDPAPERIAIPTANHGEKHTPTVAGTGFHGANSADIRRPLAGRDDLRRGAACHRGGRPCATGGGRGVGPAACDLHRPRTAKHPHSSRLPVNGTAPTALVLVSAQRLTCEACSFDLSSVPPRDKGSRTLPPYSPSPPALAWQIPDAVDSQGGVARLGNVVWFGHGTAFLREFVTARGRV